MRCRSLSQERRGSKAHSAACRSRGEEDGASKTPRRTRPRRALRPRRACYLLAGPCDERDGGKASLADGRTSGRNRGLDSEVPRWRVQGWRRCGDTLDTGRVQVPAVRESRYRKLWIRRHSHRGSEGKPRSGWCLHDHAPGSSPHSNCCPFPPRRSSGDRDLWYLAPRLWRPLRRGQAEDPSSRKLLHRAAGMEPLCNHRQRARHRSDHRLRAVVDGLRRARPRSPDAEMNRRLTSRPGVAGSMASAGFEGGPFGGGPTTRGTVPPSLEPARVPARPLDETASGLRAGSSGTPIQAAELGRTSRSPRCCVRLEAPA